MRYENIGTRNQAMRECLRQANLVAPTNYPVMILGETGSGKTLLAQAMHNDDGNPRRDGPFVPVNIAGLPASLLRAELFGSVPGAWNDAPDRAGFFEQAHKGTVFLDEIANLDDTSQRAILDVVQFHCVTRLGSTERRPVDIRIISATNADLDEMMATGAFRHDLYMRLAQVAIRLPALRDRPEDIEMLARSFLEPAAREMQRDVSRISDECMAALLDYSWPMGIRELRSRITQAMLFCVGDTMEPAHVFPEQAEDDPGGTAPGAGLTLREVERRHMLKVLKLTGWNKARAARLLDISRQAVHEKIKRYGLEPPSQPG